MQFLMGIWITATFFLLLQETRLKREREIRDARYTVGY